MDSLGLLPMWPLWVGLAVLGAALICWILLYGGWPYDD